MKIFVASDIHGRVERAKHLVELIAKEKPDRVFLLGDYLYNGPRNGVPDDYEPLTVSKILAPIKDLVTGVRGNCDSRVDDLVLPFVISDKAEVNANGRECVLIHGDRLDSDFLSLRKGQVLFYGHTHIYALEETNNAIFCNPGSISFPKNGNPPTYAIFSEGRIEIRDFFDRKLRRTLLF